MNAYRKGAEFERQLVRDFSENGWLATRTAGSGNTKYVVPDVIAIKGKEVIIIECKSTIKDKLSLKRAINDLRTMSQITGCKAMLAIKFYREKPRFYDVGALKSNTISKNDTYIGFEALIGKQNRLV